MSLRKSAVNVDALSGRFAGMPSLAEDFKSYVYIMAHYAYEEGADADRARRHFAEKLSSEPVVRVMSNYEDGSTEARTVFWEIAELCYRYTSVRDIEARRMDDDGFDRLLGAIGNIRNGQGSVHKLLRFAAKSKGDVRIEKTSGPNAVRIDAAENVPEPKLRSASRGP